MALDVRLHRTGGEPWGFRLVGGADFDLPLTIAKVEPGSVAARAGVADGDALLAVDALCARALTHADAHHAITAAGDTLRLTLLRGESKQSTMQAPPGHEPNPFIDIVPPSQPPEVPIAPIDRSLTASPFLLPLKPYRPFSAEPQEGIPPVERPIILSPNYHDNFSRIKPKDFEPPTRFKLEISKDFVPEGDEYVERSVSDSYSKVQITEMTSIEELSKEIDLEQIENTAVCTVDESSMKAVTGIEGTNSEKEVELTPSEINNITLEKTVITSENSSEITKVSASLLAQLIDQTADEISKSNSIKSSETSESFKYDSIETKTITNTEESLCETSNLEVKSLQRLNMDKTEISKHDEVVELKQADFMQNSIESSSETNVIGKILSRTNESTEELIISETTNNKCEIENTATKHATDSVSLQQNMNNITQSVESLAKKEASTASTQTKTSIEGTTRSLTEIKQQAISTANLLAEQRAYTLGLQTIPNIQGHVHSSYHYDLLLKTFFIHLTDVMVALSRIILAEGGSRSNSPMPPHSDGRRTGSQEVVTQSTCQANTSVDKTEGSEQSTFRQEGSNNVSAAKLSSLRTKEMTHKMDAVISEFRKDVEEQVKISNISESREVRGKSISKLEEEVLKEKDPLEWLAKMDEKNLVVNHVETSLKAENEIEIIDQSQCSTNKTLTENKELNDINNAIIYVATVEAHQIINDNVVSESATADAVMADAVATDTSEVNISSEKSTEVNSATEEIKQEILNVSSESDYISKFTEESTSFKESIQTSSVEIISNSEILDKSSVAQETTESKVLSQMNVTQESTKTSESMEYSNEATSENITSAIEPALPESGTAVNNDIIGIAEPEPVRPVLGNQTSVSSEDNNNTITPQTPLTDEYVFRLQIQVHDLHDSETPDREPTPPEIHEDPYTVKKPKLIPHIETCIEPVRLFEDPKKELEPLANGHNSLIDTNKIAPTAVPVEQTALPAKTKETAPTTNAIEEIAVNDNKGIEENALPGTKDDTIAQPPHPIDNMAQPAPIVTEIAQTIDKLITNASNVQSVDSFATNIGTSASEPTHGARRSSGTLVQGYIGQDILAEERRRTSNIDAILLNQQQLTQVGINATQSFTVALQNGGSLTRYGSSIDGVNGTVNGYSENGISYKLEDLGGTTQGIVDALENGGVIDDRVAKELGKPGLTEDKIAALISGESEMLKEAHVIGLKRVIASHMSRLNEDDDSVDFKKIKPQIEALKDSEVLKALNDELTKTREEKKREERKWTTFMQRPERAVPRARFGHIVEPEYPQEPYKIKIVKQPKPKVAPDYKPQVFETGPLPWELRAASEPAAPPVEPEEPVLVPESGPLYLEALDNLPESEVPDLEDTGIPLPPEESIPSELPEPLPAPPSEETSEQPEQEPEPEEEAEATEAEPEDMEQSRIAEQILGSIQSMVDPNASMEQQLVQMRAQLAALSQLPGVISHTLQLVTEQLGQLTRTQEDSHEEVQQYETTHKATVTEIVEEVTCTETREIVSETTEDVAVNESTLTGVPEEEPAAAVSAQPALPALPAPAPAQLAAEEVAQMRQVEQVIVDEQRRVEKQKKDLMAELQQEHEQRQVKQRPTPRAGRPRPAFGPLSPQERPLVLPGGRRWHGAKDVYNDEFIRETLASQAELIQGKAKGCHYESHCLPFDERVNFMKWEKPAKSLDYLKESDVYKMVHNMAAAPASQIEQMRSLVLAESEYREKCRSVTPRCDAPAEHFDAPQEVQP